MANGSHEGISETLGITGMTAAEIADYAEAYCQAVEEDASDIGRFSGNYSARIQESVFPFHDDEF